MEQEQDQEIDELQYLQIQINKKENESLECTERMIRLCEESKEAGMKTLVALDDQGEQLDKIEARMDSIKNDMKMADKALKGMDLLCGIFPKFWKKSSAFIEDDGCWNGDAPGSGAPRAEGVTVTPGNFIAKITNDDIEDKMEENMQQVSTMISNLKNMAIDMENVVTDQNAQIDKVHMEGSTNETKIKHAIDHAKTLRNK